MSTIRSHHSNGKFRLWTLLVVAMLGAPAWAHAGLRTWSGAGGDGLWSNANNWEFNVAPVNGDDLAFPATPGPAVLTNDLVNLRVRSIAVTSNRTFNGNAIELDHAGLTVSNPGNKLTINLAIKVLATQTWAINEALLVLSDPSGAIDLNGAILMINTTPLSNAWVTLNGVISSSTNTSQLRLRGNVTVGGNHTYQGGTSVEGTVYAQAPHPFGDTATINGTGVSGTLILEPGTFDPEFMVLSGTLATVQSTPAMSATWTGEIVVNATPLTPAGPPTIGKANTDRLILLGVISGHGFPSFNGLVTLGNTNTFSQGLRMGPDPLHPQVDLRVSAQNGITPTTTLSMAAQQSLEIFEHQQTLAGLNGTGSLLLTSFAGDPNRLATLTIGGTTESIYAGTISGNGRIRKVGTGRLVFSGNNTGVTGDAIVDGGTLEIGGAFPMAVNVLPQARLVLAQGAGLTGAITVNGADLVLGSQSSETSTLSLTSASFSPRGTGTTIGRIKVQGAVSFDNTALTFPTPFDLTAPAGTVFTLIDKVAAGPITGTFNGLPEGSTVTVNDPTTLDSYTFRISYVGGNGNDIVLTLDNTVRGYLLSEGATSAFFTTDILLANPTNAPVNTSIDFFPTGAPPSSVNVTLPALSRKTVRVNDVAGLATAEFSTEVRSLQGAPIIVERTMTWDATGYGSHTEHAVDALSTSWFFAEGSQGFFFSTYLLLANPQDTPNVAKVRYVRAGLFNPPVERTYALEPRSRRTIDLGADPDLPGHFFGMIVNFDQPGMAERAMYFGTSPFFSGGHESAGVTSASTTWFVPEGATGPFFQTYILITNPNQGNDTDVTLTFLPQGGAPVIKNITIPGIRRHTVDVENIDPALANVAVATQVVANRGVIVERAQYWPDPNWHEATNSFGVTALNNRWGLAEGRIGMAGNYQTYILLANPGNAAADVAITFLRDGQPAVTKTFNVPAQSRFNVPVGPGTDVPELQNETFGALIVSTQAIAVERAMYSDANGVTWAAGTSATAVPVP